MAKANPAIAIGSYPFFDPQHGPNTNVVLRARDAQSLRLQNARARGPAGASPASTIKCSGELALSRRKQGLETPLGKRHYIQ